MTKLYIKKDITSRELLNKVLKENNIDDEILYNAYGKPYLKNNKLYFNISHKDNITVLVTSNAPIGVDIEKICYKEKVIAKVCNDKEKMQIKTPDDFTKMWVKKEAYVKYLGIGLSYGLENVDTTKINNFIIKKYKDYYIAIYSEEENLN